MIEMILDSKVVAVLAMLITLVMLIHTIVAPSAGTLAVTILVMSYSGLVGFPALMKKGHVKE